MLSAVSSRLDRGVGSRDRTGQDLVHRPVRAERPRWTHKRTPGHLAFPVLRRGTVTFALDADSSRAVFLQESEQNDADRLPAAGPLLSQEGRESEPKTESVVPSEMQRPSPTPVSDGKRSVPTLSPGVHEEPRVVTVRGPYRRHELGVQMQIMDRRPKMGFLPFLLFPLTLLSPTPEPVMEPGHLFKHLRPRLQRKVEIRQTNRKSGQTVISAVDWDKKIILQRMEQLRDLSLQDNQTFRGYILGRNPLGLIIALAGYKCLLPKTRCAPALQEIHASSAAVFWGEHAYKEVDVLVIAVERVKSRVILNNTRVAGLKELSRLQIGSLLSGRVAEMKSFGAFIALKGLLVKGLIHVRNISDNIVAHPENVFEKGETIYAVLTDIDLGRGRLSLSTALLEETRGEMVYNKERVMKNAPIMAARLQEEIAKAREVRETQEEEESDEGDLEVENEA